MTEKTVPKDIGPTPLSPQVANEIILARRDGLPLSIGVDRANQVIILSQPDMLAVVPPVTHEALLLVEKDSEYNEFITRQVAHTLVEISGREIPAGVDVSGFESKDDRNRSVALFQNVWDYNISKIRTSLRRSPIGIDDASLLRVIRPSDNFIQQLTEKERMTDNKWYFVHNNAAPERVSIEPIDDEQIRVRLTGFDAAGVTRSRELAQMTDLGNYIARCWQYPDTQLLLTGWLLEEETFGSSEEDRYEKTRAAFLYGSLDLAKYGLDPAHPEHTMTVAILGNLGNVTESFDRLHDLNYKA